MIKKAVKKLTHLSAMAAMNIERVQEMCHNVATTPGAAPKLKRLRCDLFENRLLHMLIKGQRAGKVTEFDADFYAQMSHTFFQSLPISMIIKYLGPDENAKNGQCFERSLLMFLCFDNALLVRGDNKGLELIYGKGKDRHGWIEIGDTVYDPTTLNKYPKDFYYKLLKISNIEKMTYEEFVQQSMELKALCTEIKATTIADFQSNGYKRSQLLLQIPEIKAKAQYQNNPEFQKELADYLQLVQYPTQEQTSQATDLAKEC